MDNEWGVEEEQGAIKAVYAGLDLAAKLADATSDPDDLAIVKAAYEGLSELAANAQ